MKRCLAVFAPCALVVLGLLPGSMASAAILTVPGFGGGSGHQGFMVMPEPYVDSSNDVQIPVENQGGVNYTPQLTAEKPGDTYTNKWSILNGMAYCRDYGWYDSLSNLDDGQYFWMILEDHSQGLVTYDGSANLIFANTGDRWRYNGSMVHNVYATASRTGTAFATYDVYVGDAGGVLDGTINYGEITFRWNVVPEPASLAVLACGALALLARRRRLA